MEEQFADPYTEQIDFNEDIYKRKYIDELLEDDELSFEEAAFMTGYCDFA